MFLLRFIAPKPAEKSLRTEEPRNPSSEPSRIRTPRLQGENACLSDTRYVLTVLVRKIVLVLPWFQRERITHGAEGCFRAGFSNGSIRILSTDSSVQLALVELELLPVSYSQLSGRRSERDEGIRARSLPAVNLKAAR